MHRFINFNWRLIAAEDAAVFAVCAAALYGKSIFTTVAVYHSEIFLWEKHWARLIENAGRVGVDLSQFTEETIKDSLRETVEKNGFETGRARLTFFDESASRVWQSESSKSATSLLIQTADFRPIQNKLKLAVSPFRINSTSPLAGVKSGNYLENILAWEDAKSKGCDEAIRLNEKDEIVGACLANIFWKKDGEIFTASLETGCLKGTTREFLMENQAVRETKASLRELYEADEIFLTSAGIGIVNAEITK